MKDRFQIPEETLHFLQILGKDPDQSHIRLIHNPLSRGNRALKGLCQTSTLEQWTRMNASIYVVVNNGGDADADIQHCVALFIEHDNISKEEQAFCYKGVLPEPTMQVDTGGKSLHQYWVFDQPVTVEQWQVLTLKAINALGSDPTVSNPSRLMRLPGFYYYSKQGIKGPCSTFYSCSGKKYTYDQLLTALSSIEISSTPRRLSPLMRSSNADWLAARPCPICGRDLDEKCRMRADYAYIQCHLGDTFCPPQKRHGEMLKGHDGQIWKRKANTAIVYGDAVGYELVQTESKTKVRRLDQLVAFVREQFGHRLAWNSLKQRLEMDDKSIQDLNLLYLELAEKYGIQQKPSAVQDAFLYVGKQNAYHPVKDFLLQAEACETDLELHDLGARYIGFKTQIESVMFGNHLLAAVYRAFQPGYPYDQILILRGSQGVGKTRTIKLLSGSPDHYVSSSVIQQDKDFLLQLGSCWHCELEEIDGHIDSRHEAQLKALISRHTDNYRAPYAAASQDQPRPCVLTGTTNQSKLLVDATGNRRFLIATIPAPVDLQQLERDLQKIWSTVMKAYRQGVKPYLTLEEQAQAAAIASTSFKEDPWLSILEAAIKDEPVVFEHAILRSILQIEPKNLKGGRSSEARRVKDCLMHLGYRPHEHQVNGLDKVQPANTGWPERTRGVWFAPGIEPTSNGQEVFAIINKAGKKLPMGPQCLRMGDLFNMHGEPPF